MRGPEIGSDERHCGSNMVPQLLSRHSCALKGNPLFALRTPVVLVISVVAVISAYPPPNTLVCGCLSCACRFRRFRDSRLFREDHPAANHRFGKP